jgi:hypothetical protein
MTAMLPMLLAALLATATDPVSPPSEAQVERFMAVLPDVEALGQVDRTADPVELERLVSLNPGRDADIRPVLETFAACQSPIHNAMSLTGLRMIARRLGSAGLERLTAFYQSEDLDRLEALTARLQAGEAPGEAEQAEMERIFAAYPLREFQALMQNVMTELVPTQTEALAALDRCDDERDAAFARLELETQSPPMPIPVAPPIEHPSAD